MQTRIKNLEKKSLKKELRDSRKIAKAALRELEEQRQK